MNGLYTQLREYSASDYYGFHMPGHKRQSQPGVELPYEIDITEIDGFDDLHHACGILKDAQELAARVYGAEESRYLVNGSTAGILSGILGSTDKGDRILVARHCHKSVYHAIYLNELKPVYLYPESDAGVQMNREISVSAVRTALMGCSGIRAVVIVSPTFDGVISDIRGIADVVHEYGIPLIVDEAHGAHLGFHPYFGENALAKGADIVIHSVHKTLPALTQTALLHVQGELADRRRIFRYLDMFQSSSPSYVLMASIDHCVRMLERQGAEMFASYVERLEKLRMNLGNLKYLRLFETENYDRSKIVISVNGLGMTGKELYRILLERYHLQMEMAAGTYVIAMTSVCDSPEGFARLEKALSEIDAEFESDGRKKPNRIAPGLPVHEQVMTCAEALKLSERAVKTENETKSAGVRENAAGEKLEGTSENAAGEKPEGTSENATGGKAAGARENVAGEKTAGAEEIKPGAEALSWQAAVGRVSAEYAYLYPPGSPLLVPGERIAPETVRLLEQYQSAGFSIEGIERAGHIRVLRIPGK